LKREIKMKKEERKEEGGIVIDSPRINNATPHEVVIVDDNGEEIITFSPIKNPIVLAQKPIRLETNTLRVGALKGLENDKWIREKVDVPLSLTKMGAAEELPPQKEGQFYIVSRAVQEAYPERQDFLIPNETVRDEEGKIVGCKSLAISPGFKLDLKTELNLFLNSLVPMGTQEMEDGHKEYIYARDQLEPFLFERVRRVVITLPNKYLHYGSNGVRLFVKDDDDSSDNDKEDGWEELEKRMEELELVSPPMNFWGPVDDLLGLSEDREEEKTLYTQEELERNIPALIYCLRKVVVKTIDGDFVKIDYVYSKDRIDELSPDWGKEKEGDEE
jgi:hypothetical protein